MTAKTPSWRTKQAGTLQLPVAGVTLLAVLMMVAVSSLMMGAAAETWRSMTMHDLEDELEFRGEQYKWAIEQYWAQNRRPPTEMDELCPKQKSDRKYLRKCWKDPITGQDWRRIMMGQRGRRRAENEARKRQQEDFEGAADVLGGFTPRSTVGGPTASEIEFTMPGRESDLGVVQSRPFIGVASPSNDEGFKILDGTSVYSEWEFVAEFPRQLTGRAPAGFGPDGQRLPPADGSDPTGQVSPDISRPGRIQPDPRQNAGGQGPGGGAAGGRQPGAPRGGQEPRR